MRAGASEAKIAEVTTALTSDLFDESEKTALEYAEAITFTDRKVTEELFARVRARFSEAQIVELTAAVERSGLLAPQLLALVYLRVALINGCPF